jgi:hypothetical protein
MRVAGKAAVDGIVVSANGGAAAPGMMEMAPSLHHRQIG